MRIHLGIFIGYLVAYFFYCLNASIESFDNPYKENQDGIEEPDNKQTWCRYKIFDNLFLSLTQMADLALIILFVYLSVNFSAPLSEEYRKKFLLIFQKNELD